MKEEEKRKVGKRIKKLLKLHQCNQNDLARAFSKYKGVSFAGAKRKVSDTVRGKFEADYDFWACLYEMFEVNIGYVITEKGEPYVKPFGGRREEDLI